MLDQIQFHVHQDEIQQQAIEHSLARNIKENYRLSLGAFERIIPTLAKLAKESESRVSTLLCNKFSELNIVNYNSGKVLYGMHPRSDVLQHLKQYTSISPSIDLPSNNTIETTALICFGLGLGYHIEYIINKGEHKHLVVYEPNIDYFICSLSSINWRDILKQAKDKNIALYLQIGSDVTHFSKDMMELSHHVGVNKLVFYKHLNLNLFNSLEAKLNSGEWSEVERWLPNRQTKSLNESYLPLWAPLQPHCESDDALLDENKKKANLTALKKYFPNLYEEFSHYRPQNWRPIVGADGAVSVVHIETGSLFSNSPKDDAVTSFSAFTKKPNKDGLLLSYKGKKLKGYLHYQLVEACNAMIQNITEVQSTLPEKVKSLIMFGVGIGYSVEALMKNHDTEMLFICEPNKDFFYASLYAIDWSEIIQSFDEGKKRLYLNIGDDGSNLTNDLLVQFQSVGPYVLANTFFYQAYINEKLTDAVAQLREQLLVIIAMGDYFDNAKYGIAHTRWALESNIPFLLSDEKRRLTSKFLDVPVFIVGNGPSLDDLLETLKAECSRAIVISCGTALYALHKNGITPDFHAEIETNRSTFDWLSRIDDTNYLQSITLLSCNGIHPDSARLFGNTLLAFKQGEASTVSFTEVYKKHPFKLLNFSYPTVLNFAADLVTTIGFKDVYLFGTDLGFVSDDYHHSKSSGYYDNEGQELYSYASNHQISLVVKGNFKPWVKTKYEFKVSKNVLEQIFASKSSYIYNLSNGAQIKGAEALFADDVLIVSTAEQKQQALSKISSDIFSPAENEVLLSKFDARYDLEFLFEELTVLEKLLAKPIVAKSDIEELVSEQREFIVSSLLRNKSLVFYYLNGTFNYINSIFSNLLNVMDEELVVETGNSLRETWKGFASDFLTLLEYSQYELDAVSPHTSLRRNKVLAELWDKTPFSVQHRNLTFVPKTRLTELATKNTNNSLPVVINWVENDEHSTIDADNTCNIVKLRDIDSIAPPSKGITLLSLGEIKDDKVPYQNNYLTLFEAAMVAMSSRIKGVIFLQKVSFHPSLAQDYFDKLITLSRGYFCYAGPDFLILNRTTLQSDKLLLPTGDRLVFIPRLKKNDFRKESISQEEYIGRVKGVDNLLDTLSEE